MIEQGGSAIGANADAPHLWEEIPTISANHEVTTNSAHLMAVPPALRPAVYLMTTLHDAGWEPVGLSGFGPDEKRQTVKVDYKWARADAPRVSEAWAVPDRLRRGIKQMRDCASGNGDASPCMGCWEDVARMAGYEPFPSDEERAAEDKRDA